MNHSNKLSPMKNPKSKNKFDSRSKKYNASGKARRRLRHLEELVLEEDYNNH